MAASMPAYHTKKSLIYRLFIFLPEIIMFKKNYNSNLAGTCADDGLPVYQPRITSYGKPVCQQFGNNKPIVVDQHIIYNSITVCQYIL